MFHPAPFQAGDADVHALQQAISAIVRCGYCESSICQRLGLADITALNWRHLPMYRAERLTKRDQLDLAIALFLLQGTVDKGALDLPTEVLAATGVLTEERGLLKARASLYPVGTRLIFSDLAWPELSGSGSPVPYDQVMAIGPDSRHLAHSTVRRHVGNVLDLCTGSGIHGLLGAAHADRVLAVDINPRAVQCTRFNAQALGIGNLEVVEGDLYSPVPAGQKFDVITANPPFVPAPVQAVGFRDGGPSGEDIQKRIVAGLPNYLAAPGGIAQMVTELGEREGEPLTARLRRWLGDAPIDIYLLRLESYTAIQYALGHAKGDDYPTFLESAGLWADNLRRHRYISVQSVIITFAWNPGGEPWEREDVCAAPQQAAGGQIESIIAAERRSRGAVDQGRFRRTGPIARFDGRVLGGNAPASATATLLGQSLKIEYALGDFERQVLDGMEAPLAASDLFHLARGFGASEETLESALRSLIAKRLITVE